MALITNGKSVILEYTPDKMELMFGDQLLTFFSSEEESNNRSKAWIAIVDQSAHIELRLSKYNGMGSGTGYRWFADFFVNQHKMESSEQMYFTGNEEQDVINRLYKSVKERIDFIKYAMNSNI